MLYLKIIMFFDISIISLELNPHASKKIGNKLDISSDI